MTDDGRPDPLNARLWPFRVGLGQALAVLALIAGGIVFGARMWQPVKTVEQRVAAPISAAVQRRSPLDDLPDLVAAACPALVSLHYKAQATSVAPQGILVTGDGYVATTAPLPTTGAVEAWLDDGRRLAAAIVARDASSGIGLLKLDGNDLPFLQLADADLPRAGSWGFTLVAPAGRGCLVAPGAVAGDFIAEGAGDDHVRVATGGGAVPPGTPFLAADGRVLALARSAEGSGDGSSPFVPADLLGIVVGALMRGAAPVANRFGILAEDLVPVLADRLGAARGRGAAIMLVAHGSVAEAAGLRAGDVVLSEGRAPISGASELNRALAEGGPIDLVVARGADRSTLTITLPLEEHE